MKSKLMVTLLLLVTLMTGCNKGEKPLVLKDGTMLFINVKNSSNMRVATGEGVPAVDGDEFTRLSPKELVQKCQGFYYFNNVLQQEVSLGISEKQKDFQNLRIKMWPQMIIREDGSLNEGFLDWRDVRLIVPIADGDFGGYIPNEVMREASAAIRKAYENGDNEEVYRLFEEAFTAIPVTKKEWQSLKDEGKQ